MNRTLRSLGLWLLLGMIVFSAATYLWQPQQQHRTIRYDEFWDHFQRGHMREITLWSGWRPRGHKPGEQRRSGLQDEPDIGVILDDTTACSQILRTPKVANLKVVSEPEPSALVDGRSPEPPAILLMLGSSSSSKPAAGRRQPGDVFRQEQSATAWAEQRQDHV